MNNLEKKISEKIHEFDIISLLRLLMSMNYRKDEIRFRGHNSICSQPSLIKGIEFKNEPVREAVIKLNLGLLSAQSPLPSYFRKKIDSFITGARQFDEFIGYIDHHLIWDYICNLYPEINRFYFLSWELTKRRYLEALDLKSCTTLHWLFQTVFPEISVKVEKALLGLEMQAVPIRLGESALGSNTAFGSKSRVSIHGRRVTLCSEEDSTDTQVPWPWEIKNRLKELVFPLLRPTGIDLEINLVLKSQKRWARLHLETYLGYDRIRNGGESYRRIRIFRGHIGEADTSTEESTGQTKGQRLAIG
jgi:hypothetical protein